MAITVLFSVNEMREIAQNFEDEGMPGTIVIIRLAPRAGKMNRISRCDWLPERARWS